MSTDNLHSGHRQRMHERFRAADETYTVDSNFRDHELLELLLFYAQPRVNTNETAHRLINRYGSIRGVMEAPMASLLQVEGVGPQSAELIRLVCALTKMHIQSEAFPISSFRLTEIADLVPILRRIYFAETAIEHVLLMMFAADGSHIRTIRISDGTQTGVAMDIPTCIRMAVIYEAASVVLVHNHPAAPLPSDEDLALTERMKIACEYVRVELREHLVLTENTCYGILQNDFIAAKTPKKQS